VRRRRRPGAPGVDLSVALGPLRLPNPVVAASGTFGHGDEVAAACDPRGLGAVTAKSVSPEPWPGNPGLRLAEAPGGGMLNAIGLPGPGADAWVARDLPALAGRGARVIASIWGRTVDDFARAAATVRTAAPRLVALEVNVSCPNLDDRSAMFAHSSTSTASVTRAVVGEIGGALPVFVKLSPNAADLCAIAGAALAEGATGLTLVNTALGLVVDADARAAVLDVGGGGLSGTPLKPIALRAVADVWRAFPGTPIIGTGGVSAGTDAVEMMLAGASAVGVGTATFADPRATLRVVDELAAWCVRRGVHAVSELTGAMEVRR
jgi:dihydroorotate dehydrogenase (NAD+) catalytic subunit